MGKYWVLVATAIVAILLICPRAAVSKVIMNSPLFEGRDLAGNNHSLADQMKDGKTTIVFFWALRCAPCLREMAALDELYKARHQEGLEILAIEAAGNSQQRIEEILDQLKDVMIAPRYPIIPDPDAAVNRKFSVQVAPRTFLVNKLGEIVYSFESFSGELHDELKAGVDALLAGREIPTPDPPLPAAAPPAGPAASTRPETAEATPVKSSSESLVEEEYEKNRYYGDFYFHKEEYERAVASYVKCIRIKPDDIHVRLKIGEAYAKLKMNVEAREAWEQIIRTNPGNAEAAANLRRLFRGEY